MKVNTIVVMSILLLVSGCVDQDINISPTPTIQKTPIQIISPTVQYTPTPTPTPTPVPTSKIPIGTKTIDLLPKTVKGYKIVEKETMYSPSVKPRDFSTADEVSYAILEPDSNNPNIQVMKFAYIVVHSFSGQAELNRFLKSNSAGINEVPESVKNRWPSKRINDPQYGNATEYGGSSYSRMSSIHHNYLFEINIINQPDTESIDYHGIKAELKTAVGWNDFP
jgi:hypothetical protein